jgi:hypothetical protein
MMRPERAEHLSSAQGIDSLVPRIVCCRLVLVGELQVSRFALLSPPVVDELVAGDADQPRDAGRRGLRLAHGGDGGEERLGGEVLGERAAPAARQEVAVDLRQGGVVQPEQLHPGIRLERRRRRHHPHRRSARPNSDAPASRTAT